MITKNFIIGTALLVVISATTLFSCKKFLDEKPVQSLQVPQTLKDLQGLLDAYVIINRSDPSSKEVSSDDFYLSETTFAASNEYERRLYTWQNTYVFNPGVNDWSNIYRIVFRANTVLENMNAVPVTNNNLLEWQSVKGQASFLRGKAFFDGIQIWGPAYNASTTNDEPGIPLRLGSDFNEPSRRAPVGQSYAQVLSDLKLAASLLPDQPLHPTRPSRPAAFALLARTYLAMRDYPNAGLYADSALAIKAVLIDYNGIDPVPTYPIPQFNAEVLYDCYMFIPAVLINSSAIIVPQLYSSYEEHDLRKLLFFRANMDGSVSFRGSYEKSVQLFTGLATDELYLTRAECSARSGNLSEAKDDLNTLLRKRYKAGFYIDLGINTQTELLNRILLERRKELLMRGTRWMDIKRLNQEGRNIVLKRSGGGINYELIPNAKRYAIPLPEDLVQLSGLPQNNY
jgi:hypothetical protein